MFFLRTKVRSWDPHPYQNEAAAGEGKLGRGLSCDGSDDYVSIYEWGTGGSGTHDDAKWLVNYVDAGYGISLWFKSDQSNDGFLFAEWGTQNGVGTEVYGISLSYVSGTDTLSLYEFVMGEGLGTDNMNLDATISDTTWHHLAVSNDGTDSYLYLDGELADSGTSIISQVTLRVMGRSDGMTIGGAEDEECYVFGDCNWHYVGGSIDEVMIFDRTLSETEIDQLYAAGT